MTEQRHKARLRFVKREHTDVESFNEKALGIDSERKAVVVEHDGEPHDGKIRFAKGDGFFVSVSAPVRSNG